MATGITGMFSGDASNGGTLETDTNPMLDEESGLHPPYPTARPSQAELPHEPGCWVQTCRQPREAAGTAQLPAPYLARKVSRAPYSVFLLHVL